MHKIRSEIRWSKDLGRASHLAAGFLITWKECNRIQLLVHKFYTLSQKLVRSFLRQNPLDRDSQKVLIVRSHA
jgi:hypothetical protein